MHSAGNVLAPGAPGSVPVSSDMAIAPAVSHGGNCSERSARIGEGHYLSASASVARPQPCLNRTLFVRARGTGVRHFPCKKPAPQRSIS